MPKVWKKAIRQMPWICDEAEESFSATLGEYHLTVESKRNRFWVWKVHRNQEIIKTILDDHCTSQSRAIAVAEGFYFGYKASQYDTKPF
jgi:hypothetical protein